MGLHEEHLALIKALDRRMKRAAKLDRSAEPQRQPKPTAAELKAAKRRAQILKQTPTLDDGSTSVHSVGGGAFESDRRRH
jgi:hypothetical protein